MKRSAKWFLVGGVVGLAALVQPWVAISFSYSTGPTVNWKLWLWDLPDWTHWVSAVLISPNFGQIAGAFQGYVTVILIGAALVLVGSLVSLLKPVGPVAGSLTLVGATVSVVGIAMAHASARNPVSAVAIAFSPDIGNVGAFFGGAFALVGYVLQRREGRVPGGSSPIGKAT